MFGLLNLFFYTSLILMYSKSELKNYVKKIQGLPDKQ